MGIQELVQFMWARIPGDWVSVAADAKKYSQTLI